MKRLDAALCELKLAPSRSKAHELISSGEVEVRLAGEWKRITQPSFKIQDFSGENIRLNAEAPLLKYVSRGGLKLEGALDRLKVTVQGWRALDLGVSTGGFTDCLLQRGCQAVIGVDVGHGQLAPKLAGDPRLTHFEGVNARAVHEHEPIRKLVGTGLDLCVADLSFISLQLILPALDALLPAQTRLLALVKPQFEAGPQRLGSGGVVRDPAVFAEVQTEILRALAKYGFSTEERDYFPSSLKGQDGNQEFFVYARRT